MLSNCRLCDAQDLVLVMTDGRNRDLNYFRCGNCGLWNYDLDSGLNQEQYTEVYVSPTVSEFKHNRHQRKSWAFLKKRVPGPGRILDIGCGNGGLLYEARKDGWQVKGMELTATRAETIQQDTGIEVIVSDFLTYQRNESDVYDVVVLRHVLEHLPDPILAMERIGALLKPGGVTLMEFPNTRSVSYAWKRFLKNRGWKNKKFSADWRPGHCNEFCREAYDLLLQKTGFELLEWRTYSNRPVEDMLLHVFPVGNKARVLARKKPG